MSNLSETDRDYNDFFEDIRFYNNEPLSISICDTTSSFEEINFIGTLFIPEKSLLYAVLGRAYHDLAPNATKEARRDAIKWFTSKKTKTTTMSYKFIIQALDLTDKYQKKISEAVLEARMFQEKNHSGE